MARLFNSSPTRVAVGMPSRTVLASWRYRTEVGESGPFPDFSRSASIPTNRMYNGGLLTIADDKDLDGFGDGFLGGRWFGDKVWEFDYHQQRLTILDSFEVVEGKEWHPVRLGFQVNEQGARTMHFPRMQIEVDGRAIDVLLDTGATATLTESSGNRFEKAVGTAIGTSFITQTIFDQWKSSHPEWETLQNADVVRNQLFSMIEVPQITVGGQRVGPVWFTARPDSAFVEYMSSMMDEIVYGALGGSGLRYFRVVVDYPNSAAYFFTK